MNLAHPLKLISSAVQTGTDLPLPGILRNATRAGVNAGTLAVDPLLAEIAVSAIYQIGAAARGEAAAEVHTLQPEAPQLLALESEDGATLFIRSDALAEAVARRRPEAVVDGVVDFSLFRDPNASARGLGDVMWKLASVLRLGSDGLLEEAKEKALEWAKEKLGEQVTTQAYDLGSFLGAKALIWKIESRLAGRPGLYRWHNKTLDASDRCLPDDPRLQAMAAGKPALVLIHGTGSYTLSAYADLREHAATWDALQQRFPGGIFGFEHRTFSESPLENALALLNALPKGAQVSLLTHSRGGLVGDLLCLGQVKEAVIDAYRIDSRDSADPDGLEREAQEERARLRAIRDKLAAGHISVQRYVRVASPARGTRFLSDNLDAALSDFLNLLQWGGGALVGVAATALGGPVAGENFGKGASSALGVVKRLVLEIAGRRIDPRMVPGIAAMRTDSPLGRFLAHPDTRRHDDVQMAVIAGDTEFDGFGASNLGRRIANLFCDWRLFDRNDNDLVVDTDSMYAGLAFRDGARYLYDQDDSVTHFRYFANPSTRDALRDWLTVKEPDALTQFQALTSGRKIAWQDRTAAALRGGPAASRPVAILIPGIMGSHIELKKRKDDPPGSGDRIWFDIPSLFLGKLEKIGDPNSPKVFAEDLFEMFYGDLADHLAATHNVIRCPYDWRRTLDVAAGELKAKIEQAARAHPGQPIRLLAHSMGGLVVRALMQHHADAWNTVLTSGGRLVMLGTPNNGSHLMVHTLLGKSDSMRKLEMLDAVHGLQQILDIVAGFPGALSLLPRPNGFIDAGQGTDVIAAGEYYQAEAWPILKSQITDRWYDDGTCALPAAGVLGEAEKFWARTLPDNEIANPERVSYVFGQSDKTPCGVQRSADGRLKLLFTPDGDGSVTWASGRLGNLDADTRCWYMPVEHADLTGEEAYFPAIVDLLEKGVTDKLGRLPRRRGEAAQSFTLEAEPPVLPGEEELARAFLGSGPRHRKTARGKQALKVSVRAGDLRFLDQPVLCGHYIGDAISGAEAALDEMLDGALSERERLSAYAAEIGTSAIVLRPPNTAERHRGSLPGAVIVGLGQFTGQLSARQVSESVRAGVLRFLLQLRDVIGPRQDSCVQLNSVLIGWNSTASISVAESVAAITRGVLEANRQFCVCTSMGREQTIAVGELCFIELYRDAAISAAHAARTLPDALSGELNRLGARLEPAASLIEGAGVVDRLSVLGDMGHWSRLIVTDADAGDVYCPPECYAVSCNSPIPRDTLRRLCQPAVCGETERPADAGQAQTADASPVEARYYPERLKYVFLSQRARAETLVQQRQPGLLEALIGAQRRNPGYDPKLGHTLFQLMVPLDYKAAAREQARLLLVLDGYTANLPWELLQSDAGAPEQNALVLLIPMVRQLATTRYRPKVRSASTDAACIIVAPSTANFDRRFPGSTKELAELPGAIEEGQAINTQLRAAGWSDVTLTPPGKDALDILNTLFDRPYRVLAIGAHGVFEAQARDGRSYSGVVLSDGLLITAVEVSQMEVVPELVFLSCCHLGSVSNAYSEPNRLAYSLARELIETGVRCVVAAGWAVDDAAACTFASTFFERLSGGATFADALFAARKTAYRRHPGSNTWGAYQAYGDPGYRLRPNPDEAAAGRTRDYVSLAELLSELNRRRIGGKRRQRGEKPLGFSQHNLWLQRQLAKCPPEWADHPEVLQAIAQYYGELGADGFDAARQAYQRAIQLEDRSGRVALRSIEQLANMEARHGGKLADKGQIEPGLALIDSAIRRLNALAESVQGDSIAETNAERAALLGSAYKLRAAALAGQGADWSDVLAAIAKAAQAYNSAVAGKPAKSPYNTLNWLPLAWLANPQAASGAEGIAIALQCGETARRRYAVSKDFWDAVMSADAEMTAWLLGHTLGKSLDEAAAALRKHYAEAMDKLPQSDREWDSVVKQWRLLARFIRLRNTADTDKAKILETLADEFRPQSATTFAGQAEPPADAKVATKAARKASPKAALKTALKTPLRRGKKAG